MTDPTPLDPIDPSDLTPVPGLETQRLPVGLPPVPSVEGTVRIDPLGVAEALSTGPLPDQTLQLNTGPLPPPPPPVPTPVPPSPYTTHELPPPPSPTRRHTGRWIALGAGLLAVMALGGLILARPDLLGLKDRAAAPQTEPAPLPPEAPAPPLVSPAIPEEAEVPPALRSYHEKALRGDANAMAVLGTMYYNGLNVPANRAEGLKWLRRAAEKGNTAARKQLSQMEGR